MFRFYLPGFLAASVCKEEFPFLPTPPFLVFLLLDIAMDVQAVLLIFL